MHRSRVFLVSAVFVVFAAGKLLGQCVSEACLRATEWHRDFAVVHLEKGDFAAAVAAKEFIESQGGVIAFVNERILLGWIPPMSGPVLRGRYGVRQVYTGPVNVESFRLNPGLFAERQAQILLSFFNEIASGRFAQ